MWLYILDHRFLPLFVQCAYSAQLFAFEEYTFENMLKVPSLLVAVEPALAVADFAAGGESQIHIDSGRMICYHWGQDQGLVHNSLWNRSWAYCFCGGHRVA